MSYYYDDVTRFPEWLGEPDFADNEKAAIWVLNTFANPKDPRYNDSRTRERITKEGADNLLLVSIFDLAVELNAQALRRNPERGEHELPYAPSFFIPLGEAVASKKSGHDKWVRKIVKKRTATMEAMTSADGRRRIGLLEQELMEKAQAAQLEERKPKKSMREWQRKKLRGL